MFIIILFRLLISNEVHIILYQLIISINNGVNRSMLGTVIKRQSIAHHQKEISETTTNCVN